MSDFSGLTGYSSLFVYYCILCSVNYSINLINPGACVLKIGFIAQAQPSCMAVPGRYQLQSCFITF